jgi:hypothetical protein
MNIAVRFVFVRISYTRCRLDAKTITIKRSRLFFHKSKEVINGKNYYAPRLVSGSWNAKGQNSKFSRFKINTTPQYLILYVHRKGVYTHIVQLIYLPFLLCVHEPRDTLLIVTRKKIKR